MMTMQPTHAALRALDLNLLLVLQALLVEMSVSRAADVVGLSQPAASRALGRLREHFDDELLVRSGSAMILTARAQALRGPLAKAIDALAAVVAAPTPFHPATSQRSFRLATTDYALATVVPTLLTTVLAEAPQVAVDVRPQPLDLNDALAATDAIGDDATDIVIVPRRAARAGIVWTRLFRESFVCVAAAGTFPSSSAPLSIDELCAHNHILVSPTGRGTGAVDDELAARGRHRQIAARVPSFLAVLPLVLSSPTIAAVPERLAQQWQTHHGIQLRTLPFSIGFTLEMAWHERMRDDDEHTWFRRLVQRAATSTPTT